MCYSMSCALQYNKRQSCPSLFLSSNQNVKSYSEFCANAYNWSSQSKCYRSTLLKKSLCFLINVSFYILAPKLYWLTLYIYCSSKFWLLFNRMKIMILYMLMTWTCTILPYLIVRSRKSEGTHNLVQLERI